MRELRAGSDAVLLDFSTGRAPEAEAAHVAKALRSALHDGALASCDVVLSAHTILVEALPGAGLDELSVLRVVHRARHSFTEARRSNGLPATADLEIPVVYDGADLAEAAQLAEITETQLAATHSAVLWTVQFMGFAPGFGYLVPAAGTSPEHVRTLARITRRTESRPVVPAGSVAVAAGYSAVYPRSSPGGWFLLGTTDVAMWDSAAEPPSRLTAGMTVRFRAAQRPPTEEER
ncbi:5-oxoprolinase subunit B family protein [Gordonia neofelifaecis]|uniref:Allophanate hydrolase subunit 1 n=1 Tax=Gordonia neofelifaecis NRRL B-59395 TaxID=644548 RepID=F1YLV5_9ACTN|nr:carboxyltransferase domain-containing protein [Gordonia neofelifaecis]EGD54206.1 Allophanate hydrolase subunit 1 [Gordonia neofelifaecis NRRL B-59395]